MEWDQEGYAVMVYTPEYYNSKQPSKDIEDLAEDEKTGDPVIDNLIAKIPELKRSTTATIKNRVYYKESRYQAHVVIFNEEDYVVLQIYAIVTHDLTSQRIIADAIKEINPVGAEEIIEKIPYEHFDIDYVANGSAGGKDYSIVEWGNLIEIRLYK